MERKYELLPFLIGMLVITSCVHEAGHAWAAWRCGDRRAYINARRVPWTFKHINVLFTLIVPTVVYLLTQFVFGLANPVMVRTAIGPRRMALVALAGPCGNFLVAAVTLALAAGLCHSGWVSPSIQFDYWYHGLTMAVGISIFLGCLNLLPIPPLDGSRIAAAFMPEKMRNAYLRLGFVGGLMIPIGFIVLFQVYPELQSSIGRFFTQTLPGWERWLRELIQT